jgi:hypothetical protein
MFWYLKIKSRIQEGILLVWKMYLSLHFSFIFSIWKLLLLNYTLLREVQSVYKRTYIKSPVELCGSIFFLVELCRAVEVGKLDVKWQMSNYYSILTSVVSSASLLFCLWFSSTVFIKTIKTKTFFCMSVNCEYLKQVTK